jgi:parallel beta-helix repeat protein
MLRTGSIDNTIKDNTFSSNRVGILLFGGVDTTVKDNLVSASVLAGIRLNVIATGNSIERNTVVSNPAGIDFITTPTGSANGNTLKRNTIALNTCGVKGPVANNTLTKNIFKGNGADSCP